MTIRLTKLITCCIGIITLVSCANQSVRSSDPEKEKAAILKVIKAETEYFIARDIEGLSTVFANKAYIQTFYDLYQQPGVVVRSRGYDDIMLGYKEYFNQPNNVKYPPLVKSDIQIEIRGEMAWVTFVENQDHPHHGIRILEKIDGEWKIALLSVHVESAEPFI